MVISNGNTTTNDKSNESESSVTANESEHLMSLESVPKSVPASDDVSSTVKKKVVYSPNWKVVKFEREPKIVLTQNDENPTTRNVEHIPQTVVTVDQNSVTSSNSTNDSQSNVKDGTKDALLVKTNMFSLISRNWPQIVKILPGILFMWTAGMKLFWQTDIIQISSSFHNVVLTAWFISVTVGALLAFIFIISQFKTTTVYITTTILHLTPVFTEFKQASEISNPTVLNYGTAVILYVNVILPGFIYGLNFVTILCYAVDYTNREFRSKLVQLICKAGWIFTAVMKLFLPQDDSDANIFKHCIYISVAVMVFITIYVITRSSFDRVLQNSFTEDDENNGMQPIELQPMEYQANGWNLCSKDSIRSIVLVFGTRILSVLVNNISMLFIIVQMTDNGFRSNTRRKRMADLSYYPYPPFVDTVSPSSLSATTTVFTSSHQVTTESSQTSHSTLFALTTTSDETDSTWFDSSSPFSVSTPTVSNSTMDTDTMSEFRMALTMKVVFGIGIILGADCIQYCFENREHVSKSIEDCFRRFFRIRSHRIYCIASTIFAILLAISKFTQLAVLKVLVILLYTIIGVGIDAISFKHLAEGFPLKRRSGLIAIVLIIETFFDNGLIVWFTKDVKDSLLLPIAGAIGTIAVCVLFCLPTKRDQQRAAIV